MNIDSDKLLEWFRDYIRHAATNTYAFSDHQREFLDKVFEELQDAIQSGELTPNRVYARAPEIDGLPVYITPGAEYEADPLSEKAFAFYTDAGVRCVASWEDCDRLHGANWERIEK